MSEAIKEAYEGINKKHGGPFGTVIVKDNKIIGKGHNQVLLNHDPTCHGEMMAIRDACKTLSSHDLSDCTLYTTAAPCPMCKFENMVSNRLRPVHTGLGLLEKSCRNRRNKSFFT